MHRHASRPAITIEEILAWADAHFGRAGEWPSADSGPIPEAPGQTWNAVNLALYHGGRGLPAMSSLAGLLRERPGKDRLRRPPLTEEQVLAWAEAHRRRTGRWPNTNSGPVPEAPGEAWGKINIALREGLRGLPGCDSLAQLLVRHRRRAWAPEEDELVRLLPPGEAARRTWRTVLEVHVRRWELGLPDALPG
jgi:hypothetical protein